jgi:hypothetical protein
MDKKIGYVLHPLVDEVPLASAVRCEIQRDSTPFLVVPKRYSLDFFQINQRGIEPKYSTKFHKLIKYVFPLSGKHFRLQKVDVLVVIFYDSSFIVFNDLNAPLFAYKPDESELVNNLLADVHQRKPLIVMSDKNNLIKLWNGTTSPVYKLRITGDKLIDMKFLSDFTGSNPTLAVLCKDKNGNKKVVAYTIDMNLLRLVKIEALTCDIEDENAKIIIPLPQGDADRPSFLVLGSTISCVSKNNVTTTDAPFKGFPSAYCLVSDWKYVVADETGQIMLFDVTNKPKVTVLGKVETIPTSLTQIDGNYFHVGSTVQDALFIRIKPNEIEVLNKVRQFRPVCGVSMFSKDAGAIYMSHGSGHNNDGAITSLRIGAFFKEEAYCDIPAGVSILSANDYVIINTTEQCYCVKVNEDNEYFLVTPNNFDSKVPTLAIFPCKGFFVQVTSYEMRICDSGSQNNTMKFDDEIISADFYKDGVLLLFKNRVECISTKFEKRWTFKLIEKNPKCITTYRTFTAIVTWSGKITFLDGNKEIKKPVDIEEYNSVPSSAFIMKSDITRLCVAFVDGTVKLYKIPQIVLVQTLTFGHYISGCFQMDMNTVFINGASPSILNTSGTSIQAIINNFSSGCLTKTGVAFFGEGKLYFGCIDESDLTQVETMKTGFTPYLLELNENPPALFTAHYNDGKCGLTALSIPHLVSLLAMEMEENEEINCILPLPKLSLMAVGTSGVKNGRLIIINYAFGEFNPVAQFDVDNGIYALTEYKDIVIAGGQCRLFTFKITVSPAGAVTIKQTCTIKAPVRSRALVVAGDTIVHFDSMRSITTFKLNDDCILESPTNFIKHIPLLTGFVGANVGPRVYHMFAADDKGFIHLYQMKTRDDAKEQPDLRERGKISTSSLITSMKYVRDGFSLLTTESGGVFLLIELDKTIIKSLHETEKKIAEMLPLANKAEKIVDSTVVSLFESLSVEDQNKIAEECFISRGIIINAIKQIRSRTTRLCSTLL